MKKPKKKEFKEIPVERALTLVDNKKKKEQKRTQIMKEEFLRAYGAFWTITAAADEVGISRAAFYKWCKKDLEFKKKFYEIDFYHLDFAESKLVQHIKDGNIVAIIFFLKSRHPKYRPKIRHEGEIGFRPVEKITILEVAANEGDQVSSDKKTDAGMEALKG